ncbi:hypothetical protein Ddye_026008 [Dipteronia dyeriana]|uniref:Uncharacterized protein n=1 Tax=Dipteronia dyeriana TaxID=168575 RepID=A0AAD9TM70_9ROSI|nr:hypothetical protein Ddye_026008 [Dipteronia dyeriana]
MQTNVKNSYEFHSQSDDLVTKNGGGIGLDLGVLGNVKTQLKGKGKVTKWAFKEGEGLCGSEKDKGTVGSTDKPTIAVDLKAISALNSSLLGHCKTNTQDLSLVSSLQDSEKTRTDPDDQISVELISAAKSRPADQTQ